VFLGLANYAQFLAVHVPRHFHSVDDAQFWAYLAERTYSDADKTRPARTGTEKDLSATLNDRGDYSPTPGIRRKA